MSDVKLTKANIEDFYGFVKLLPYTVKVDHVDHSTDILGHFATIAEARADIEARYAEFEKRWAEYEYRHDVLGEDFDLDTADIGVGESCMAYIESERTGGLYLALGLDENGRADFEVEKPLYVSKELG